MYCKTNDIMRIKSWENMLYWGKLDEIGDILFDRIAFTKEMRWFCGKTFIVEKTTGTDSNNYRYELNYLNTEDRQKDFREGINVTEWTFVEQMLEKPTQTKKSADFQVFYKKANAFNEELL